MSLQEISLLCLSAIFTFGTPIFFYFRDKMSANPNPQNFSRKRVFKLIFLYLFVHNVTYGAFALIFLSILFKSHFILTPLILILSLFLAIIGGFTYFGGGMYILSIIIEVFTVKQLKNNAFFKPLFTINNLFHGPISHCFIYSSIIVGLTFFAILDTVVGSINNTFNGLILPAGILLGLSFAIAQVKNGTAAFQFVTGVICLSIFIIFGKFINWQFNGGVVVVYFLSFILSFLFVSIMSIFIFWKNKNIWGRSGYRLK